MDNSSTIALTENIYLATVICTRQVQKYRFLYLESVQQVGSPQCSLAFPHSVVLAVSFVLQS